MSRELEKSDTKYYIHKNISTWKMYNDTIKFLLFFYNSQY